MWKRTPSTTTLLVLAALTLVPASSFAQERGQGRRERSGRESSGRSTERAQPRRETPRTEGGAAPTVESRQQAPRAESWRQAEGPRVDHRQDGDRRNQVGRAVPRRQVIVPRGAYAPRYDRRYSPRYSPRVYSPRSYYRPYVFRPRFSIGFGVFAGYPVPYTYRYPYPIAVYGYRAPHVPVIVNPGSPVYGAVALEINPPDAEVYVDGSYAGYAGDFDGSQQPLTLVAGTHRVEVQAPGYVPLVIDVQVQPGQVVPYRGDMQPY